MLKDEGTYHVRVATLNNEGPLLSQAAALGLPEVPEFPLTSFYNMNFVSKVRRCARYLCENKIDLVHTHDFYTNVFGMAAATLAGVPVKVASKRETGGTRSRAQQFVEKIAFRQADAIVANSNAVRDHLRSLGIKTEKVSVIYNGVDLASRNGNANGNGHLNLSELAAGDEARFITLVANLRHPVKNVPMLLRAAKPVIEHDRNAHFIVAGEGELRNELQGLAVRLGVARNVHFIGRCDDVPSLLARSSACVLTSTAEGFSNSIIEYMAAGKPVVATNAGGAAEAVIDGETGYLVEPDDDKALAGCLLELLSDREKAYGLGINGKIVAAERFSQKTQLNKTLMLYEGLLQR